MALQLLIFITLARYLGTEQFGLLSYCFAINSIFIFFNTFGLESILVKRIHDHKHLAEVYLADVLLIRVFTSLVSVFTINLVGLLLLAPNEHFFLFILSLYHLFLPIKAVENYLQAQQRSYIYSKVAISAILLGTVFRALGLYYQADALWFYIAYLVDAFALFILVLCLLYRERIELKFSLDYQRIKLFLREGYPLMLAGGIAFLYMKVDQIMLGKILGNDAVAIYVSATKLSEAWFFIGFSLIAVYFPVFLDHKKKSRKHYRIALVNFGSKLIWLSILLALLVSIFSDFIITLLLGEVYLASADVLAITIWCVPLTYIGAITAKMFVADNQNTQVFHRNLIGLMVNIGLNLWLIPAYGAIGAALASLIAQFFAYYLLNYMRAKSIGKIINMMLTHPPFSPYNKKAERQV